MYAKLLASLAIFGTAFGFAPSASAQSETAQREIQAATESAFRAAQESGVVHLGDQATLKLPPNTIFVPRAQANRLMEAYGNGKDDTLMGLFMPPADSPDDWIVTANFEKAGYIKDDDAKNWDVKELLQSLRDGTEEQNSERRTRGIPELEVVGWVQPPQYDSAHQRLVWSVEGRDKGSAADADATVNYNTYALGRDGYISLDLLTSKSMVAAQKPALIGLLDNLNYNDGKKYADFNSSTDKIAEYGLAALVAGVAAKKLGLLAIIAAFVLKFGKLAIIAVAAGGGAFFKLFRRKKAEQPKVEEPKIEEPKSPGAV
ncbi:MULTISPECIES: DUF2167 domain-containing protein [unclassified Achromobacter]|uniref:DUF2167 domain-containing protein n=1 Tax=unclassified Achromobacter TaxID=2626865 RepID=UPI000B516D28|nr:MULTISPECIES: DUF2167 domain-containing protein [unclassified Achromobacter]OWT77433.1 hypothetical protein CEY04_15905 [Achromobacter sp. HZ28]OWT78314.1 hypothetical protein CEY05_10400 [Achromobacter sp. HZ34]